MRSVISRYVAGYLAKVLERKFNCEACRIDLTEDVLLDDEHETLILYKSYATRDGISHLTAPSPLMARVTDIMLSAFDYNFERVKALPGVKSKLVEIARSEIVKKENKWLENDSPCSVHREYLVQFCMKLKIFKHTLWQSRLMRIPKSQKSNCFQKVQNLTNL